MVSWQPFRSGADFGYVMPNGVVVESRSLCLVHENLYRSPFLIFQLFDAAPDSLGSICRCSLASERTQERQIGRGLGSCWTMGATI